MQRLIVYPGWLVVRCQSSYMYLSKLLHIFVEVVTCLWLIVCPGRLVVWQLPWRKLKRWVTFFPPRVTKRSNCPPVPYRTLFNIDISPCSHHFSHNCENFKQLSLLWHVQHVVQESYNRQSFFPFKRSTPKWMAFSIFKKKTEKSPIVNTSNKLVILQDGTLVVPTGPLQMGSIGTPGLAITIGKTI